MTSRNRVPTSWSLTNIPQPTSGMNREDAYSLLILLQKARRAMDVSEPLAFVRDMVRIRQRSFVYDVLAILEEAEGADYEQLKALLTASVTCVNRELAGGGGGG